MEKSCFIEVETISHARNVNRIESKESFLNERNAWNQKDDSFVMKILKYV